VIFASGYFLLESLFPWYSICARLFFRSDGRVARNAESINTHVSKWIANIAYPIAVGMAAEIVHGMTHLGMTSEIQGLGLHIAIDSPTSHLSDHLSLFAR